MAIKQTEPRKDSEPDTDRSSGDAPRPDTLVPSEWLETDGLGGYACSTLNLTPERRYHGLLLAPRPGTPTRHLFLAGYDERLVSPRGVVALSTRRHAGAPDPPSLAGDEAPRFEMAPWPRAVFPLAVFPEVDLELTREILMPKGEHTVLVRYALASASAAGATAATEDLTLLLRPRVPCREADKLTFRNDVARTEVELWPDGLRCQPYDALPPIAITVGGRPDVVASFRQDPDWEIGVEYRVDLARGYDGHEDLFSPGEWSIPMRAGSSIVLAATIGDAIADPQAAWAAAVAARRAACEATSPGHGQTLGERCSVAADDFLYRSRTAAGERLGILAGFPWFEEWGRDTFISLPGLTLARGRLEECAEVLSGALAYLDDGLLPNIFGADRSDSHYGSVDAALWYARAVLLYQRAGGVEDRVLDEYLPALVEIADAYAAGSSPRIQAMGIGADAGGLIHAGTAELNPTWMDAKPASGAVTPRHGCPVEICALWYSMLCHIAELARKKRDKELRRRFARLARQAGRSFVDRFWLPGPKYLADVWRRGDVDVSVRPNMVLAAALEFSPLSRSQRAGVVARVGDELLTPVGLRTLSPKHADYVPRYAGGTEQRDRAYHQGTVWPWLLGFYCEAALRVDPSQRTRIRGLLAGFAAELERSGINHVSEVFDGDAPHRPGGSFAQAWNTAEILRALAILDERLPLNARSKVIPRNESAR